MNGTRTSGRSTARPAAPMDAWPGPAASADFAEALIRSRRTVLPRRLAAPGPDAPELRRILEAAAAAPDHDRRVPWRFVLVGKPARARLADAFEASLRERDPEATVDQRAQAREKAYRAPTLMLAVVREGEPDDDVPLAERFVSAGCAIQNILLMATACGYGSSLTSGKALQSAALRGLFALGPREQALCFINIGTAMSARPGNARPAVDDYFRELEDPS
jgi:nitroreductase